MLKPGDTIAFFHDGFVKPPWQEHQIVSRKARVVRVHDKDRVDLDVPLQPGDTLPGGGKVENQRGAVITNVRRCEGPPRTGTWTPIE